MTEKHEKTPEKHDKTLEKHDKTQKKHKEKAPSNKQQKIMKYAPGAVAVVVILLVIFLVWMAAGDKVLVTVNGEKITQEDIDTEYNRLPASFKESISKDTILNQTISKMVLLQEAEKEGITVSEQDIDDLVMKFKTTSNIDDEQLNQLLDSQNITMTELRDIYRQQLMISKLITVKITSAEAGDADAKLYYESNKQDFIMPEQVKVSHILILVNDNRSEVEALTEIKRIQKEITSTNFGELAEKYSEDPGSNRNKGEYTFGRGLFVKEFEDAAFTMKEGDVSEPIKTQFGYHLIKLLEKVPAGYAPFTDVKDQIKQTLSVTKKQQELNNYIEELRQNADIQYSG